MAISKNKNLNYKLHTIILLKTYFIKKMSPFSNSLRLFLFCLLLLSCKSEEEPSPSQRFTFDFESGTEGWTAGFSDYPADWDKSRFEFRFEHSELPEEVNNNSSSLLISGTNLSDDLFMFLKKEIRGLKPNHHYLVSFELELASRYPEQSVGVGGSPGASVYLKAGASATEPRPVEENGEIRMNIDKGSQSKGGEDMRLLGTVGIPGDEFRYQLIQRDNLQKPLPVRSDASGNLWLIVGTDSGFESTTTLFYNSIQVIVEE